MESIGTLPDRCHGCCKRRIFEGVEQLRLERDSMGLWIRCLFCAWRYRLSC